MSTGRDLIKSTLRLIGAIASGETPSSAEASDALVVLNQILDSWSLENLLLHARAHEEFALTAGSQSRTMGPGGNFNTTRPIRIEQALIRTTDTDPIDYPLKIATIEEWARITSKQVDAEVPTHLLIENTVTTTTLYFYPVPTVAYKAALYSWKALTEIATLDTTLTMPPGYERALRYNLAIELAPEYGKTLPGEIIAIAGESKEVIKRSNIKPQIITVDEALLGSGSFNILTGE